jgi:hypothetical protein
MVAVSIFTIVVTVGIGALIVSNSGYNQSRKNRHAIDALSSSMEYITRQLRTGALYTCGDLNASGTVLDDTTPRSNCYATNADNAITFIDQDGRQISVFFSPDATNPTKGRIARTIKPAGGGTAVTEDLTDISVVDVDSFQVHIDGALDNDNAQPIATLVMAGSVTGQTTQTFRLQGSVSQRTLDVPPATL